MKALWFISLLFSYSMRALEVVEVYYNPAHDQLEIDVAYEGGCVEHRFELRLENCAKSYTENLGSVNVCDGRLVDASAVLDTCHRMVHRKLKVLLETLSKEARPVLVGFENQMVLIPKQS
ncbi:MAG: hypothetical protein I8H75_06400 [Myxococcaceae bacterium]|nr:hypothetical protein [Myxococcaceae bacterium]MBH2006946.1 hypothetical protein [Myxococcaceae bacterium]